MTRLEITDTVLRDAHQSLLATRMKTEDMIPICEKLDKVGYHSLGMFGGATFDTMMRSLDEDPQSSLRPCEVHHLMRICRRLCGQYVMSLNPSHRLQM